MNFKIKVCGMCEPENIKAVAAFTPDFIGFIFYEKSPRYVGSELAIPTFKNEISRVGVFVNHDIDFILAQVEKFGFNHVQLHGHESPELCSLLRSKGLKVIKAIPVDDIGDFSITSKFENRVDYFLFDTKSPSFGGTGKSFNWNLLNNYKLSVPFFLSGGLNPENIEQIKKLNHPALFALDFNSGIESAPGIKDLEKLKSVLTQLNQSTKV